MHVQPIAYVQRQVVEPHHSLLEDVIMPEYALPYGFVYLDEAMDGVLWDAKYASEDNFTGSVVNGYESNRIVCSEAMVGPLKKARDVAAEKGYQLLIFDAARPQCAVDRFMEWANAAEDNKTREAHYPSLRREELFQKGYVAKKSAHSRGAAVDLTLVDVKSGEELDMGGIFDLMDEKSHHGAVGLTEEQERNRNVLKGIMEGSGFSAYDKEWWHYTLDKEPFPGEYYDFVIVG